MPTWLGWCSSTDRGEGPLLGVLVGKVRCLVGWSPGSLDRSVSSSSHLCCLVVCLISVVLDPELCALSLGSECVLEKVKPAGS